MNERNKVILLIGLILSSFSGIYLYQGYNHNISLVDQVFQVTEDKFNSAIDSVQEFSFIPYSNRIENLLTTTPGIISAFADRNRELLYQRALPRYQALMLDDQFFQVMHFHLPNGSSFLRMHNPTFFNDDLTEIRPMVTAVHKKKNALTGYEIGRHGPFYRIVHPIFYNDNYIGALEFGIQAHKITAVVEGKIDAPVTSFFKADLLQNATHFHGSSYKHFGEFNLFTHDQAIYSELPETLKLGKDQHVTLEGQTFIIHSYPLFKNYQDQFIGGITVLQNITPFLVQKHHFIGKSGLLILSLSAVAFIVLYLGFGKIMGSLVDEIATRKKAQSAATKAKKEWERTFDAVPDLITILDKDFRIIRTNKALPERLGLPMNKVMGRRCYQIFCGKDKAPQCCPYRTLQENKQSRSKEIFYEKLHVFFDVILSPLYDEDGEFIGAVHVARDISQRRILEQNIRDNNLYLQSILEASVNTAIIATDNQLLVKFCNPEAVRLLGYPADTIINRSIKEIHAGSGIDTSSSFEKAIDQVQQQGFYQVSLKANGYILDAQISSLTDEDGGFSGLLLIGRNVTAQKEAEQKLLKAEKFEAIGLLAGGVAHDLNNILSGIVSYPEILRYQLPEDSDMHEPLLQIQKAGRRAADVVTDLLTMARGIAHAKEILSLNDLLSEYIASPEYNKLSSLYPKVIVNTQLDQNCWNCKCSPTHIIKIVMNLVSNAIEAITDTGDVFLTTYNQKGAPQQAGGSLEGDTFVVLQIRDTGTGIAKEHLEHIFEPFYSTKKMGRSGSGLGLSIVWNTIQEHGGSVTVGSDTNGTVFTIYLPACMESIDRDNSDALTDLKILSGNGTVLIVDDDEDQRTIARQMLAVLGYTAHAVISGEEAVIWLQNNSADLLLLDMQMGSGKNGRETYEEVIRSHPEQKALITSGFSQNSEMKQTLQLGVSDFISKPYSIEELGCSVQQIMRN